MTPELDGYGPTVEGVKLFKGRGKFHSQTCYDIGPYISIRHYMLAYYDKEIYYYTHASNDDIDDDLFDGTSRSDFINKLRDKRAFVANEIAPPFKDEHFVLCHNDFQGRNILMQGTEIAAVIDWEFAGSYPLRELDVGGIEVVEMEDDATEEECFRWCGIISKEIEAVARERRLV